MNPSVPVEEKSSAQPSISPSRVVAPRTDIIETPASVILEIELPLVREGDLNVQAENDLLTVEAVARPLETGQRALHHEEHAPLAYRRTFQLPPDVRRDGIEAQLASGVLSLTIPKAEELRPRVIPVQVK